jgi:hypothetical protein
MQTASSRFFRMPNTKPGWRSVWLELTFVVLFIVNVALQLLVFEHNEVFLQTIKPVYMLFVFSMLACGLAGGVAGLIATMRNHERSSLVWLAILIGLFVFLLVLNELTQFVVFLLGR